MKLNKKVLFPALFGLLIIAILSGYYYLNQSHRNIKKEEAKYKVTAFELEDSFSTSGLQKQISDQVIQVSGRITELDEKTMTLDKLVEVSFIEKLPSGMETGMEVAIKGRCVGYDDLLKIVKVDQAILIALF
jgi:hypothetical protein